MISVVRQVIKVSAFAARGKNFSVFAVISSVSSLRPNAWSSSTLPSMVVLNAAFLVETLLVESQPVRACSTSKTSR